MILRKRARERQRERARKKPGKRERKKECFRRASDKETDVPNTHSNFGGGRVT